MLGFLEGITVLQMGSIFGGIEVDANLWSFLREFIIVIVHCLGWCHIMTHVINADISTVNLYKLLTSML